MKSAPTIGGPRARVKNRRLRYQCKIGKLTEENGVDQDTLDAPVHHRQR